MTPATMQSRRTLKDIRRRSAQTTPKARIVLVCEGEKTEVIYFSLFVAALRAANVSLRIAKRDRRNDPQGIVQYAKKIMREDGGIDQCYCGIDRDTHGNFDAAINEALTYKLSLNNKRSFTTIASYPCFEYWFILHFIFTRSPFSAIGKKSAADCVVSLLKQHIPAYAKNNTGVIQSLSDKIEVAINNAERAHIEAVASGEPNPSTEVYLLVKELKKHGI